MITMGFNRNNIGNYQINFDQKSIKHRRMIKIEDVNLPGNYKNYQNNQWQEPVYFIKIFILKHNVTRNQFHVLHVKA